MRHQLRLAATIALALCGAAAQGEVRNSDGDGFEVGGTVEIAASADQVWTSLVTPAQWWDKAHTFSGKAENLTLRPVAGGCFCEALPHGGGVEHMRVIHSAPGHKLVMRGALGPLQSTPANGVLSVIITERNAGSGLTWTYAVSGLRGGTGQAIAAPVDQVIASQFAGLARLAASRASAAPRRR